MIAIVPVLNDRQSNPQAVAFLMYDFESLILNSARYALEPMRAVARNWQKRTGSSPVAVLFYHRVADVHLNPWTIQTNQFRAQMEWLVRNFDVISLDESQQRIAAGQNHRPSVSITFDDGYAENLDFAIPWLLERSIPVTYFVTLDNVLGGKPFPHDVEAGQPLPVNTAESIRAMANCGINIGAHSRTHPNLARIANQEVLVDEIVGATRELAELIEQPVRHFAFPFGTSSAVSRAAALLAREAGLLGICSANNGINLPGDDPFHIARIHGDPCMARVQNWLCGHAKLRKNRLAIDRILNQETDGQKRSGTNLQPLEFPPSPESCQHTNCDCHAV